METKDFTKLLYKCKCKIPNFKKLGSIIIGNENSLREYSVKTCQNCHISEPEIKELKLEK